MKLYRRAVHILLWSRCDTNRTGTNSTEAISFCSRDSNALCRYCNFDCFCPCVNVSSRLCNLYYVSHYSLINTMKSKNSEIENLCLFPLCSYSRSRKENNLKSCKFRYVYPVFTVWFTKENLRL